MSDVSINSIQRSFETFLVMSKLYIKGESERGLATSRLNDFVGDLDKFCEKNNLESKKGKTKKQLSNPFKGLPIKTNVKNSLTLAQLDEVIDTLKRVKTAVGNNKKPDLKEFLEQTQILQMLQE